jgi:hypothetical protein
MEQNLNEIIPAHQQIKFVVLLSLRYLLSDF